MKNFYIYLIITVCVMFAGCGKTSYLESSQEIIESESEAILEDEESSSVCYVQVSGAVNSPGVYELEADQRVYKAIEMAGGLREDADVTSLNQAEAISDGQMIYVHTVEEILEAAKEAQSSNLVNINSADEKLLMTLPGVGESKAKAIVGYRDEHGNFSSIEDIKQITGIKDGVFNKIKDQITVGY